MKTHLLSLSFFLVLAVSTASAQVCPGGGPNFSLAVPFDPAWIYGCNTGTSCNGGVAFDNRIACLPVTAMDACAPAPSCGSVSNNASNVWYSFFANSSTARISCFQNTSLVLGIQAFSGGPACGSLVQLGCALSSGPSSGAQLNLSGLTAGTLYYFRIFGSANPVSQRTGLYCFCGSTGLNNFLILPTLVRDFAGQLITGKMQLRWSVSGGTEEDVYLVERSSEAVYFEPLPGMGIRDLNLPLQYAYTDASPLSGNNYYRLKHVYKDGHYEYSKTIAVKAVPPGGITIIGNPVNQTLQLLLERAASIAITDLSGKTMQVVQLTAGNHVLPAGKLANGIYLLQAIEEGSGNGKAQKFVVSR